MGNGWCRCAAVSELAAVRSKLLTQRRCWCSRLIKSHEFKSDTRGWRLSSGRGGLSGGFRGCCNFRRLLHDFEEVVDLCFGLQLIKLLGHRLP